MAGDERDQGWSWGGTQDEPDAPPPGEQPRYGQYGQPQEGAEPPRYGQNASPDPSPQYGQYGGQSGGTPPPQYGASQQYGQYGAPQQHGAPGQQYGAPQQYGQYGAPTGWGAGQRFLAASQPGIIPLRPLNLGEMLDGAFRSIRANPRVMFGLSLIVMAVVAVVDVAVSWVVLDQTTAFMNDQLTPEAMASFGATAILSALLAGIAATFATSILTGLLILSVSQSVLGRVLSLPALWQQARGQIWRLIGQTLLVGVIAVGAMLIAIVVSMLLVGGLVTGTGGGEVGGLVAFFAVLVIFFLTLVAGAWLGVRLSLAAPALMLERTRVLESLRRSWRLTQGHFWRIFGVLAVAVIIVLFATAALSFPVGVITGIAFQADPMAFAPLLVSNVLSVLISAVTVPFIAAVLALVYVDVRMRKEGLDVELARAAEAG